MGAAITSALPFIGFGAGASAADTLLGGGLSHYENVRNQHFQAEMLGEQQKFSREEAEKLRDWQTSERVAGQEFTADQAEASYNRQRSLNEQQAQLQQQLVDNERAYNTPAMQVQRLRNAGLNPAVYFGGSSSVVGSNNVSAPSSGSQPIPSSPTAPGSSLPSSGGFPSTQLPSFNFDFADTISKLATAGKTMSETKTIDLMRNPQYKELLTRIAGQELSNESIKLANTFDSLSLPKRLEKLGNEVANLAVQTLLAESDIDRTKSQTALNKAYERLQDALRDKTDTEYLIAKNELAHWKQSYDNKLKTDASERAKNYGLANEANTRAEVNKSQVKINEFVAKIKESESDFTWSMLHNELEGLKRDNLIKDEQLRAAEAAADIAKVNASHAEELFWKDFIGDIVQQGFDAFLGYRNMKSWERLSSASQQNASRKIEEMKWKYGDSFTDTYKKTDADGRVHNYSVTRHSNFNKYSK